MSTNKEEFQKLLGERIEKLRLQNKKGVREFALLADIEHHQLINIEKGRVDPRTSTLRKISLALGIKLKDLVDIE